MKHRATSLSHYYNLLLHPLSWFPLSTPVTLGICIYFLILTPNVEHKLAVQEYELLVFHRFARDKLRNENEIFCFNLRSILARKLLTTTVRNNCPRYKSKVLALTRKDLKIFKTSLLVFPHFNYYLQLLVLMFSNQMIRNRIKCVRITCIEYLCTFCIPVDWVDKF